MALGTSHPPPFSAKGRPSRSAPEAALDVESEAHVAAPQWRAHVCRGDVLIGEGCIAVRQQDLEEVSADGAFQAESPAERAAERLRQIAVLRKHLADQAEIPVDHQSELDGNVESVREDLRRGAAGDLPSRVG